MKILFPNDLSGFSPSGSILYLEPHSNIPSLKITMIGWPDVSCYQTGIKKICPDSFSPKFQSDFESSCPETGPVISLTISRVPIKFNSADTFILPNFHFVETVKHPLFNLYDSTEIEDRLMDWSTWIWSGNYQGVSPSIRSILGALWIEKLVQKKLKDSLFKIAYDWFLKTRHYRDYKFLHYGEKEKKPNDLLGYLLINQKPYLTPQRDTVNKSKD